MFSKINLTCIVVDHHATLRHSAKQRASGEDVFLFWVSPFILGLLLTGAKLGVSKDLVNLLVTSFSVFAALLFNLLVLLYSLVQSPGAKEEKSRAKRLLLQQIYANVSFSILVAIITILCLIIRYVDIPFNLPYVTGTTTWLSTSFSIMFVLTLAMVLKRVHILLGEEFK